MENNIVVFCAFFFGLIIKGIAGFGEPLVISPILSFFYENQVITPNMLVISLPLNLYFFFKNIKNIKIKKILPMLIFVIIGGFLGILLLSYAESSFIKILLGIVIILIGVEMIVRAKKKKELSNSKSSFISMSFLSIASGITAGLYNINMFILYYLEEVSENRDDFRSNSCFIFFTESLIRLYLYIDAGFFTREVMSMLKISLPAACLGFAVGQIFDKKLDENKVKCFVFVVFMFGGISIVLKEILVII